MNPHLFYDSPGRYPHAHHQYPGHGSGFHPGGDVDDYLPPPPPPPRSHPHLCPGCRLRVDPNGQYLVISDDSWWHKPCFKCSQCGVNNVQLFSGKDGTIACKDHIDKK